MFEAISEGLDRLCDQIMSWCWWQRANTDGLSEVG